LTKAECQHANAPTFVRPSSVVPGRYVRVGFLVRGKRRGRVFTEILCGGAGFLLTLSQNPRYLRPPLSKDRLFE
jgi:hypothetical protein